MFSVLTGPYSLFSQAQTRSNPPSPQTKTPLLSTPRQATHLHIILGPRHDEARSARDPAHHTRPTELEGPDQRAVLYSPQMAA
eukprot:3385462-Rhodomonas_salina.1